MPKIIYIGIVTAVFIFLITYFLFPNNNQEPQIVQEIVQNVSLKEEINHQEGKKKKEIKEKKVSNKIIIYSLIGIFLLVIIIGLVIFLRKRKSIHSGENCIFKFMKIKSIMLNKALIGDGDIKYCFLGHIIYDSDSNEHVEIEMFEKKEIISSKTKTGKKRVLANIEDENDAISLFISEDSDMKGHFLRFLDPEIDEKQFKNFFQEKNEPRLLDLILMVRLGIFNPFEIIKNYYLELETKKIDQIMKDPNFVKFQTFNKEEAKSNNDFFIKKFKEAFNNQDQLKNFENENKKLFEELNSLIGDRKHGYQVNQKLLHHHNHANKSSFSERYSLTYYDRINKENSPFPGCVTIFYLLHKIDSMLLYYNDNYHFNEKQKLLLGIIIRKLIDALFLFNEYMLKISKKN